MIGEITYTETMTGDEYNELRMSVDWRPITEGQGIGKKIVEHLTDKTMEAAYEDERIMFILGAAKDKEGFYEKLGFHRRPNEFSGDGMSMWRTK